MKLVALGIPDNPTELAGWSANWSGSTLPRWSRSSRQCMERRGRKRSTASWGIERGRSRSRSGFTASQGDPAALDTSSALAR
jgi:hypothetical protein